MKRLIYFIGIVLILGLVSTTYSQTNLPTQEKNYIYLEKAKEGVKKKVADDTLKKNEAAKSQQDTKSTVPPVGNAETKH